MVILHELFILLTYSKNTFTKYITSFILTILACFVSQFVYSQSQIRILTKDSLTLPNIGREYINTIKRHNNQYYALKSPFLKIYSDHGELLRTVTFKEVKSTFPFILKERKRHFFDHTFDIYKGVFVDLGCGYLTFSNDSGYATYKAKIVPDKRFQNFIYDGIKISFCENGFMMPSFVIRNNTLLISSLAVAQNTKYNNNSLNKNFLEYFNLLDTLNYKSSYPDFIAYDCINIYHVITSRRHFVYSKKASKKRKTAFLKHEKSNRIRFLRNIHCNDNFANQYLQFARKGHYMPEPYLIFSTHDSIRNYIYYSRPQNENILILDITNGKRIRNFGSMGKHLSNSDSLLLLNTREFDTIITNKNDDEIFELSEKYYSEKCDLSLLYTYLKYDAVSNKTYRLYQKPVPYTTEEYRKLFWNDPEKRDSLRLTRPTYLQIYDHNDGDKLIYDERVPAPFHILEVKGDTLWAVAGITDKGLKIVKYILKKE